MKLRIRDNSIRFRLSQADVQSLREECLLSSQLNFLGGSRFRYSLECSPASVRSSATFEDGELRVVLPESVVREWADSSQVSIDAEQPVDNGDTLIILVEKDFRCLSPREGEDESDSFPHPDEGRLQC